MKKENINLKNLINLVQKNKKETIIIVLAILLIIFIFVACFNISDKNFITSLQKSYVQNEFLDYDLVKVLGTETSDSAKSTFAEEYAKKKTNSTIISSSVSNYYANLLFNTPITNDSDDFNYTSSEQNTTQSAALGVVDTPDETNKEIKEDESQLLDEQQPADSTIDQQITSTNYKCLLTTFSNTGNETYLAKALIVTPKNDPLVSTPFLTNAADHNVSSSTLILASVNSDNYSEYTDVVGNITLNLERIDDRLIITSWNAELPE